MVSRFKNFLETRNVMAPAQATASDNAPLASLPIFAPFNLWIVNLSCHMNYFRRKKEVTYHVNRF
jgi:hypothetical protein